MIKKCLIILIAFNVTALLAGAQIASPPSLAVGLSGLVGEKGNIDVQMLTEIISQKQEELKKEGIRRVMNNALLNHSYAMWDFTHNSLEMLLYAKNKKAIEKELAEYTTNMVLVYGFAEAYLQASYQLGNSHLLECMKHYPAASQMDSREWHSYLYHVNPKNIINHGVVKKPEQLFWLSKLKADKKEHTQNFNSFFLDLVYDALKENKTIRDLGFFSEVEQATTETYRKYNKFYSERKDAGDGTAFDQSSDRLKKRIVEELDVFINNYFIMRDTYFQNLSVDSILKKFAHVDTFSSIHGQVKIQSTKHIQSTNNSIALTKFELDTDEINQIKTTRLFQLVNLSASLSEKVQKRTQIIDAERSAQLSKEISAATEFFRRLRQTISDPLTNNDYLFLKDKVLVLFNELNLLYGIDSIQMDNLRYLTNYVYVKNLNQINDRLHELKYNELLSKMPLDRFYDFVKLLTELHKLDKANTYDYVFNNIKQVSNLLPQGNAKTYLTVITENIERFAFINKEENKIEIDVEEILLQLYKRYAEKNNFPLRFYLSLGLNQTFSIDYKDAQYALKESDDSAAAPINSFSFASEKIGCKLSILPLRNFNKSIQRKNEDELQFRKKEPFISDLHLLAFGSGILYNIVNSKTSKNFSYPMIGYGAGISFYNGLDANFFIAHPLLSNEKFNQSVSRRKLIGFALDIKFMEYIEALQKKRAENKSTSK